MILPEIAAARAAVKLGSFVRELAICSTKNLWNSGDSGFGRAVLGSAMGLVFVMSSVSVGPDDLSVVEQGTEPRVMPRLDPDESSIVEVFGWVCSPS